MSTQTLLTGAMMKRGRSKQDYATPSDFLRAVERRFGPITCDLAATIDNAVCSDFFSPADNSLKRLWPRHGLLWLNPEFADIQPWAAKCDEWVAGAHGEIETHARLLLLVPASVGSDWWHEYVRTSADALFLSPRLQFKGAEDPYPKDLALCIFDPMRAGLPKVTGRWRWKS